MVSSSWQRMIAPSYHIASTVSIMLTMRQSNRSVASRASISLSGVSVDRRQLNPQAVFTTGLATTHTHTQDCHSAWPIGTLSVLRAHNRWWIGAIFHTGHLRNYYKCPATPCRRIMRVYKPGYVSVSSDVEVYFKQLQIDIRYLMQWSHFLYNDPVCNITDLLQCPKHAVH